jgi:hypothetical protein
MVVCYFHTAYSSVGRHILLLGELKKQCRGQKKGLIIDKCWHSKNIIIDKGLGFKVWGYMGVPIKFEFLFQDLK